MGGYPLARAAMRVARATSARVIMRKHPISHFALWLGERPADRRYI